jgi:hypothetical protein
MAADARRTFELLPAADVAAADAGDLDLEQSIVSRNLRHRIVPQLKLPRANLRRRPDSFTHDVLRVTRDLAYGI